MNISTRGSVGSGDDQLIAGFNVHGTAARRLLIRAVGTGLTKFGLSHVLAAPQIALFDKFGPRRSAGKWTQEVNSSEIVTAGAVAGAFQLDDNSADAAMLVTLTPGSYTVQVSGVNNGTGVALVEVYDLP
jgi:hypothetical protein